LERSKMKKFLVGLKTDALARVLLTLIEHNPSLVKNVYDIAMKAVNAVDADTIANDVYAELDALDVDELYSRSGRTRYGYTEPNEESWVMFEEALQPFIDEMKKNQQRALPAVAKTHCIGIIKGLQMFEEESISDFKDWATDAPGEYITTVVDEWKKGNPPDEDIAEIISIVEGGKQ